MKAKQNQLGFCLSIVLRIVVDKKNAVLRYSILSKIAQILKLTLNEKNAERNKVEISYVLNQFCSTMVQIHEDCQRTLIDS